MLDLLCSLLQRTVVYISEQGNRENTVRDLFKAMENAA